MSGDRIFGAIIILVALGFIASAMQLQTSLLSDPVGSKTFPILIGSVAVLCGGVMVFRPDADPQWPQLRTLLSLLFSAAIMAFYALTLKPLGFLIPTAVTAAVLSYQIGKRPGFALLCGLGLSIGLFVLFKFVLGLGLVPVPKAWLA